MQALVQSVQPRRIGRPIERRELQPTDTAGNGLPELRTVGDVGQKAGDDDDRQRRQQHGTQYRRQPQSAQGATPTLHPFDQRPTHHGPIIRAQTLKPVNVIGW
jgi:hypothetical protein